MEEAQWLVENLNGNIPQGLDTPIIVRFAHAKGQGKGAGAGAPSMGMQQGRPGPYAVGGKGFGKASAMRSFVEGMVAMNALPGGRYVNDENCLFVGGLPPDCTTEDLYNLFTPFGAIPAKGVKAMARPDGSCSGIGFVNFLEASSVEASVTTLHGTVMADGRTLEVKLKTPKA